MRPSFCEEDYAVTVYVAELVNSFTNLAYGRFPPERRVEVVR